jgi:hypothetical protein
MDDQEQARLQSEQENDPSLENNEGDSNDPSEKLTPDHPRFKDVIKERNAEREKREAAERERDELRKQIEERQEATGDDDLTEEEQRAVDKLDKVFRKRGYVTQSVMNRESTLTKLSQDHNGQDGLPKFVAIDVIEYAKKNGFGENYEAAYKTMHHDAIVQTEARKYAGSRGVPMSEQPAGGDRQAPVQFTPEEIASMSPDEYEKHRASFLSFIKPPKK